MGDVVFEGRLLSVSALRKVVEAIEPLVCDANFVFGAGGIFLRAMDSAHVALVELSVPRSLFAHLSASRDTRVGVHVPSLLRALKSAGKDDELELRLQSGDSCELALRMSSSERSAEFSLSLLEIDSEDVDVPSSPSEAVELALSSGEFSRAVRDCSMFSDVVRIDATPAAVALTAKGESGSLRVAFTPGAGCELDCPAPCSAPFALRYLSTFSKGAAVAPVVRLKMVADWPLVVEFENVAEEAGECVRFYLAPKVAEE